ncbi:MAG: hypothetical protein IKY95_06900 [Bacteroidales bacterium]|nr:hypothetical protein [Bacteroidales bacterium]
MGKSRFNTNFFETYAKGLLVSLLGKDYDGLVNIDRPDLQMPDHSLGIEVTRALEENKTAALSMLKDIAGIDQDIVDTGYTYGYGLSDDDLHVGNIEYEYWSLAQPLKRIIASKIEKVGSGFYGDFNRYGLFVFCKYDLSTEDVRMLIGYARDLQRHLDIRYSEMYLAQADRFYLCDLTVPSRIAPQTAESIAPGRSFKVYEISPELRRSLFLNTLRNSYPATLA